MNAAKEIINILVACGCAPVTTENQTGAHIKINAPVATQKGATK